MSIATTMTREAEKGMKEAVKIMNSYLKKYKSYRISSPQNAPHCVDGAVECYNMIGLWASKAEQYCTTESERSNLMKITRKYQAEAKSLFSSFGLSTSSL